MPAPGVALLPITSRQRPEAGLRTAAPVAAAAAVSPMRTVAAATAPVMAMASAIRGCRRRCTGTGMGRAGTVVMNAPQECRPGERQHTDRLGGLEWERLGQGACDDRYLTG